ncbi:MAG: deoxyribose-phosphate aldolase [Flavobacteriaceae bacterium]|nr:deoxyribose-phosphate aldolase [Flavobacteriaceae bacterium]
MKRISLIICLFLLFACREEKEKPLTAQEIVDQSIENAGGELYDNSFISFHFRDKDYVLEKQDGRKVMKRILVTDTAVIVDALRRGEVSREINDSVVALTDSVKSIYSEAINSVHYFTYLPHGLNDKAVNKELIGDIKIGDKEYYKIKVTFDQEGGGQDFEDIFVYWINKETFEPDYLAYQYQVNGGGMRFREAYNPRRVGGIRFVDYNNYKPDSTSSPELRKLDSLYLNDQLELLSKIEISQIIVNPDNYN